jgi:hypothetical protein
MVNCAMMAVAWERLTLWQYQAMLSEWNERHTPDAEKGKAPLEPDRAARLKRAMAAHSVH